ncbi:hypothetical protein [Priestia koreensis]|uniref:hypothetical protein n=1 Tax=Priestia koreensis TaxID=284581 RepID=UPI003459DF2C
MSYRKMYTKPFIMAHATYTLLLILTFFLPISYRFNVMITVSILFALFDLVLWGKSRKKPTEPKEP